MSEKYKSLQEYRTARMDQIKQQLESQEVIDRLQAVFLAQSRNKDMDEQEAFLYVKNIVSDAILTIREDKGKKKKGHNNGYFYLWECSVSSIVSAILESVITSLPVNKKKLAYFIAYGEECTFQPGYKGVLQKVQELYDGCDVRCIIVWEGDTFTYTIQNGRVDYEYIPLKPFRSDYGSCIGCFALLEYEVSGEKRERIETIDNEELQLIRSKAAYASKEWLGELFKVSTLRRVCKIPAARNEDIAHLERIINQNFDLDQPAKIAGSSAGMQSLISREKERLRLPQETESHEEPIVEAEVVEEPAEESRETEWDGKTIYIPDGDDIIDEFNGLDEPAEAIMVMIESNDAEFAKKLLDANDALIKKVMQSGQKDLATHLHNCILSIGDE